MALNYAPQIQKFVKGYKPNVLVDTTIAPLTKADNVTGQIADYGMQLLEVVNAAKSLYGGTAVIDGDPTVSDSYALEYFRLKKLVSKRRVDSARAGGDAVKSLADAGRHCIAALANSREYSLATYCNTDTNFTNVTTESGTSQWGSSADTPVQDINADITTAKSAGGVLRKDVSCWGSSETMDILRFDDDLLDLGKRYVGPIDYVDDELLARIFKVKEFIECTSQYKSSAKGQTATKARMFGKHFWTGVLAKQGEDFGNVFALTMHMDNLLKVEQDYDTDTECYRVYVSDQYDQYIVDETTVAMRKNAVA